MSSALAIKERAVFVEVFYDGEPMDVHDPMAALAIVGYDVNDEDFDYDPMVWFYFEDEAEYIRAQDPNNTEFEFYVREVEV